MDRQIAHPYSVATAEDLSDRFFRLNGAIQPVKQKLYQYR